ncbi:hypothetical protein [Paenibacillus oleatilyticus]|uniref:hypothetical protein n=1 Tax=Paenibacillus oleatilyticus TaxID=2594886 RepID=UPI001C200B28|nr:hypothetical protein [Paenibacillus oleatilyticus]MBU7317776.1 hypothetical protein [Paenibacillus oleatilyticus]
MSATIERKAKAIETEIIKDVKIGQYRVQGVPHIALSRPTPTGEKLIRDAMVDLKLARIYDYMKNNNVTTIDYSSF